MSMELTSFPQSGDDEPRRQILTGLYGKVYSAASQVLNSLLSEDHEAQAGLRPSVGGSVASSTKSPQLTSDPVASQPPPLHLTAPVPPNQLDASNASPIKEDVPEHVAPRVLTNIPSVQFSVERTDRPSSPGTLGSPRLNRFGGDGRPVPPTRTASTTVSLSDATAVPTLPGVFPSLPQTPQFTATLGPDDTASDAESVFSVASTATSRDYLAAHYGRNSRARRSHLSKDFWMKDENATTCFGCNRPFTTFRRRHHCRVCGQIFCGACTSLISSQQFDSSDRRVRCCRACEGALTNHSSSEDEDVSQSFIGSPRPESVAVRSQPQNGQERWPDILPPDDDQEQELSDHEELLTRARSFLGPHSRRSSLAYPQNMPFGSVPTNNLEIGRRSRASSLQSDYGRHFSPMSASSPGIQFPTSSWHGNADTWKSDSPPNLPHALLTVGSTQDRTSYPSSIARFLSTNTVTVDMNNASKKYAQLFLERILGDCDMHAHWKPKLMTPILEVTATVHLEHNDRIAPHDWVKIKRIPGSRDTIETLAGHVFTHTMARKSMPTRLVQPRLLLISFPVEYSRGPDRYMSLAPVIAQEAEYLQKLVDRIIGLEPTLLLSCTHICGSAIGMLEKAGIAVATQVRESALNHLARVTRADVLTSIDKLSSNPKLGTCTLFEVQSFRYKDLAKSFFFFMNRSTDPGRTAIIQGPPEETVIVKIVMEIMVDVCYSLKMETALMRDQFVLIPQLPDIEPQQVLSSSPFVNYGRPFLQSKATILEDEVVKLTHLLEEPPLAVKHEPKESESPPPEENNDLDLSALQISLDLSAIPPVTVLPTARYIQQSRQSQVYQDWTEAKLQWEQTNTANPYLFNPSSHQNLMLLFSLNCVQNGTTCIGPEQMLIEFYLDTDQTLGQFVESTCLQFEDVCPEGCSQKMGDHSRSYIHGKGRLTASVEKFPSKIPGLQESILMWSRCKICEKEMPVTPMSQTAWKYSFGKYLELSFWSTPLKMRADTCSHDFYRHHVRYFGWHDLALSVEYQDIELYEISGPPLQLSWDPQGVAGLKVDTYMQLKSKITRYWTSIKEALSMVKVEDLGEEKTKESRLRLDAMATRATADFQECLKMLDSTYTSTAPSNYLGLNEALFFVQGLVEKWNADFTEFDSQFFPTERDIRLVTAQHLKGLFGEESITPGTEPSEKAVLDGSTTPYEAEPKSAEPKGSEPKDIEPKVAELNDSESKNGEPKESESKGREPSEPQEPNSIQAKESPMEPKQSPKDVLVPSLTLPTEATPSLSPSAVGSTLASAIVENTDVDQVPKIHKSRPSASSSSLVPISPKEPPIKRRGSGKVLYLARHFEELSKEFELERQREHQRLRDRQKVMNMRQAQPVAEVFEDVEEAMRGDWRPAELGRVDSELSTRQLGSSKASIASEHPSIEPQIQEAAESTESPQEGTEHAPAKVTKEEDKEEDRKESTKVSLIRTLANFWAERTSMRWNKVQYVLSPTEHLFVNSLLIVRESEPSSVIAFCISLPDYKNRLADIYNRDSTTQSANLASRRTSISTVPANAEKVLPNLAPLPGSSTTSIADDDLHSSTNSIHGGPPLVPPKMPGISSTTGSPSSTPAPSILGDIEDARLEETMLRQTGTHMRYHFGQGSTSISCKVFYSEQFDALRRKCGCSDDYIQSLSRCSTWQAAGGKSGSSFLKTLDDRLIIKELSQVEFDSFASFAPSYFEYMAQALFHDLPTVLAKFYGFYQITIRNQQQPSSQHIKMYVMVMENLFYGRKFTRIFDLKGSMRNRKVAETGKENEVLLDENMVEFIFEKPLFVREHSKKLLRTSLYNDTLFLTKMNVMDYSLVIGIDDESKTIVAGIIDFVRTYTWDKKIESWVKGKASAGIKEPTVVSPKQYKNRFRESMEQYFLMVPDCWMQMSALS